MRTLDQFLTKYGETHRHPANQWIHFVCVPLIFISTLALGWLVNLSLFGVDAPWAPWVNLSTVTGALILLFFYSRLGLRPSAWMTLWFAISVACILAVQSSPVPLWLAAVAVWGSAWVVQLIGHQIEGAKPSFFDDIVFLLIGPLFVLDEFGVPLAPRRQ